MYGKGNVAAAAATNRLQNQFALWCMFSAPLMLGCDIRNISIPALAFGDKWELLKINQDPEARPPFVAGGHLWDK